MYANTKAIATKLSEMEVELYQTGFSKGEMVFTEVEEHEVLDLLDKPNPFTIGNDFLYVICAHLLLVGDTFILKQRTGSIVTGLFILDPTKIKVNPGDANDGYIVKSYEYKDTVDGKAVVVTYEPEDIIPIKEPNPGNPYRGKSVVEAAAQAIDTDVMAGEYNKKFFENSAVPQNALTTDQRMSAEDIRRIEKDLKRNYGGVDNSNKTMVLTGGLAFQPVSTTQKDMEFSNQQMWTRDKIMALFGNTKTSLGIVEDVNRANGEASMYAWLKNTVRPHMKRIVNAFNEYLLPEFDEKLLLGFEDPVPDDRDGLVTEANTLVAKAAIITVNEARQMLDYDPIDGGDELPSQPDTNIMPPAEDGVQE